jgi:hypothetical protein
VGFPYSACGGRDPDARSVWRGAPREIRQQIAPSRLAFAARQLRQSAAGLALQIVMIAHEE